MLPLELNAMPDASPALRWSKSPKNSGFARYPSSATGWNVSPLTDPARLAAITASSAHGAPRFVAPTGTPLSLLHSGSPPARLAPHGSLLFEGQFSRFWITGLLADRD